MKVHLLGYVRFHEERILKFWLNRYLVNHQRKYIRSLFIYRKPQFSWDIFEDSSLHKVSWVYSSDKTSFLDRYSHVLAMENACNTLKAWPLHTKSLFKLSTRHISTQTWLLFHIKYRYLSKLPLSIRISDLILRRARWNLYKPRQKIWFIQEECCC